MTDVEELKAALDYPWAKWTIFLHPAQRDWVERDFNGPARVSGSAGTGKTIVALHRAVFLARKNPEARVLLTTFSDALANALHAGLRRLIASEPRLGERIDVLSMSAAGERLYQVHLGKPRLAGEETIRGYIREAAGAVGDHKFSPGFLFSEWSDIVDAWQLDTWDGYRAVARLGRKTRLSEAQRELLWKIFDAVNQRMEREGLLTPARMYTRLAGKLSALKQPPYDHVVVDESQDISIAQLRLLASLGADQPNRLFFAGDLGQRIFQLPFSWLGLGVDIRGRSRNLRVNYRTSHQIRMRADRLLGAQISDVDGAIEDRKGTVSVFNGPAPDVRLLESEGAEAAAVAAWLSEQAGKGVLAHEIGLIVRSADQIARARAALECAKLPFVVLDEKVLTRNAHASVCTMHLAKGLEFRSVAVMACDDEVIPLQSRIETVTDDSDLEEVYNTERHLLYVACTRARDNLLVTAVTPGSEFLGDLGIRTA